jgi:membrane-bound inhibitor of C-type lysozyme
MKNYLCALFMAGIGLSVTLPSAIAQEASKAEKKAVKKSGSKKSDSKSSSKKKAVENTAKDEDDIIPDIVGSTTVDYQCEMGNKVTIYENQTDSQHVALRWGKKLHRLKRVSTTTGASRFENKKYGLVWIGIPAKGILLDSKKGQQLANECKTANQMAPKQQDLITKASETTESAPAPSREQANLASQ